MAGIIDVGLALGLLQRPKEGYGIFHLSSALCGVSVTSGYTDDFALWLR